MWNSKTEYRVLICGGNDYGKRWDTRLNEVVADTRAIHKLHSILQDIRDTKVPDDCILVLLHSDGVGTDKITEEWATINSIKTIKLSSDSSIEDGNPNLIVLFSDLDYTTNIRHLAESTGIPILVFEEEYPSE